MKRLLLIDADILVYTVASSAEVPTEWQDDLWTLHSDFENARLDFTGRVDRLKHLLKADDVVMALTTMAQNFRKDIYPQYKHNRKKVRKPLVWGPLRDYCAANYTTFLRDGLEGDDCLGILATRTSDKDVEKIVVSIDKDFNTIPGLHYNQDKPEQGIRTVTECNADYFHMLQTLMGDATDGYPGCKGIGPKSAVAVLDGCCEIDDPTPAELRAEMWRAVVGAYKKAGFGEDYALVQARCARILRASDYDFKNKKPILWGAPRV